MSDNILPGIRPVLFSELYHARFSDDIHFNLARELEFLRYAVGDLTSEVSGFQIIYFFRRYEYPDFATG